MNRPRTAPGMVVRPVVVAVTLALVAAVSLTGSTRTAEAIPGPVPGPRQVALTFDDGPAAATGQILDILAAYDVPATFFVLGAAVGSPRGRALVERMHREGHSVQNHTFRHPFLTRLPSDAIAREIASTSWAVEQVIGVPTTCFRPPYGATNARVRASALGHHEIMWTADTNDYKQPGVGSIVANALRGADGRGMIVLMHDGGGSRHQTVAALPAIIEAYAARGYEFVNLCRDDPREGATENGTGPAPVVPIGAPLGLEPLPPIRVLDTRLGGQRIGGGTSTTIDLPDTVPDDTVAVIAQITAVDPAEPGWLGSHRCGTGPPGTSSLNVDPRVPARAGTTVAPVVDGRICIHTSTETHVLVDVTAAFVTGAGATLGDTGVARLFDSRTTGAALASGTESRLALPGLSGALVNITATGSEEPGFVTAWPCERPRPTTSVLNQSPSLEAVAAATILPVGADGQLCLMNEGATALIVDLIGGLGPIDDENPGDGNAGDGDNDENPGDENAGDGDNDENPGDENAGDGDNDENPGDENAGDGDNHEDAGDDENTRGRFQPVEQVRLLDTRIGTGGWSGFVLPGTRIDVTTTVPPGATALVTVTATESDGSGYLVVWDAGRPMPPTSALNHDRLDVANLVGVTVDDHGRFAIAAEGTGSSHVVIDLYGWFTTG